MPRPITNRWRRLTGGTPPMSVPGPPPGARVVQICHPDWRGLRSSADAFGDPVLLTATPGVHAAAIARAASDAGTERVVIHGWPPGADVLATALHARRIAVAFVSHSSPAQHGTDGGEAEALAAMANLAAQGVVDRIGFVKAGVAGIFRRLGLPAHELLNRMPRDPVPQPANLGEGDHIGIFLYPYWRKNATTQILAAVLLGATAHVMRRPAVPYLDATAIVEHGTLPRDRFLPLVGAVDINLHVTLAEAHPMLPMESYRAGVPCLVSHTSALFADDRDLLAATAVAAIDDPDRIARAARMLRDDADTVVPRALAWLRHMDGIAAERWSGFTA